MALRANLATAVACLAFVIGSGPAGADEAGHDQPEAAAPQAAYPYFSRPPAEGDDYDTWQGAAGPDIGEVTTDPARLPSRVDNSERPQYPPVYRQRWGACGQFAAAANIFTYEMNVLEGNDAGSDATRFPAHFSWNMINSAENMGSEAYHGWEVAKHIGLPTAATYGGVRLDKIGLWPNGYDIWHDAMTYRVAGYRYSPANTVAQLNEARGWLFDRNQPDAEGQAIGGILAMDGRMGELDKVTVTIPEGQHAAGEDVWTRWGPTGYGHGLTCVGYDDNVGVDLNGDGQITNDQDLNGDGEVTLADWERGAYIVVNSWGENWSGDGRIYLLYSAMIDDTWERGNFLGRVEVARHQPRMTLRLTLACDDRTDLRMTLGLAADPDADAPEYAFDPQAFNGWPVFRNDHAGHVPLAGPGDDTPLEVGIDLTHLRDALGPEHDGNARLFLKLSRADGSDATGQLHEAAVRLYDTQGQLFREVPIDVTDGNFGESTLDIQAVINELPSE